MNYPSIRIEGSIVSPELFDRLEELPGQRPADFGLSDSAAVKDEIARAWADAQDYWRIFHRKLETMQANATGTTETRNLWIAPLLGLLGYQLEYQQRGPELNAKVYPISHRAVNRANTPVHIIGYRDSAGLDRKPERSGGPRMSSHALVQEYLNLSEQLYAVVTNGRLLRLLRDSSRLVKLTYLEFDLDRIFNDGLFADFAVLYRLLHATRLPAAPERTAECLIERYHQNSVESGARIREGLSLAVEKTLESLANGFLSHPRNDALRAAATSGKLAAPELYQHLLRLIYRLLFLFVVEERDLVYPATEREKRELYYRYYSLQRLRRLARKQYLFDHRHSDAWLAVLACFRLFEAGGTGEKLGIAPLAGRLFGPDAIGLLHNTHLDNATILSAFDALCTFEHPETALVTVVNYGALATEEFGSVYERLLELHPVFLRDGTTTRFTFKQSAGNERKTSGSYYTPSSLVECLLDSALDPVVDQRIAGKSGADAEQAILTMRVCDPACGSGHFLIAAAQRLARRLATLRAGGDEPSLELRRHALREIISHCIYGVDLNPMAVELCKVTLWLEATEPGKPLSFLDHHVQCGNSLLGATPRVLFEGLPDEAFNPLTDDDLDICKEIKKRNKEERRQLQLFHGSETRPWDHLGNLPAAMLAFETMGDDTAADLFAKEQRYADLVRSSNYLHTRFLADAWCAAFVWKKTRDLPYPITNEVLRKIERNPHDCAPWMREEIERLRDLYQFFHWHLAFPEVFPVPEKGEHPANEQVGWSGGFDLVVGNPPWDMQEVKDNEFFAVAYPEILAVTSAKEKAGILEKIRVQQPQLWAAYLEYCRVVEGQGHLFSNSGRFPLSAIGRLNLYRLFIEASCSILSPIGRVGIVIPSGFASDSFAQTHFASVFNAGRLVSFWDFENRKGLFPNVDSRYRFSVMTILGNSGSSEKTDFVFFAHDPSDLSQQDRHVPMSAHDAARTNPLSGTPPQFRSPRDFETTLRLHAGTTILCSPDEDEGWPIKPTLMFMMNASMKAHRTAEELLREGCLLSGNRFNCESGPWLPLYEGKMVGMFDHRAASIIFDPTNRVRRNQPEPLTSEKHGDPNAMAVPIFWLSQQEVAKRCGGIPRWALAVKDVTSATNERTVIGAILPSAALTDSVPWLAGVSDAGEASCLLAALSSFPLDFAARQKVSGLHLRGHYLNQLPIPGRSTFKKACAWAGQPIVTLRDWILPRVLELTYTAWDLEPFARDCGWSCPPFLWNEARRFQLRCELDAAFLHLYGLNREDAAYILDTFPIVRRKDEATYVTYRTKDTILAIYDQLAEAQHTSTAFISPLSPPPGDLRACHPKRKLAILAFGSLRHDPGLIGKHIAFRIKTETPFLVEYGRLSNSRGGGPTVVPHEKGAKVEAELLILPDDMPVNRARDLLWLRERRKEDTNETYSAGNGPNAVLVRDLSECPWAETVLYTDFNASGKVTLPADALAKAAVESVAKAPENKDGISYLAAAVEAGIRTPLTEAYRDAILRLTGVDSLTDALIVAKTGKRPIPTSTKASTDGTATKPAKKSTKRAKSVGPIGDDLFAHAGVSSIGTSNWMDQAFTLRNPPRTAFADANEYRAALVPELLRQLGPAGAFDRFHKAYWLLTQPAQLTRFSKGRIQGAIERWEKEFPGLLRGQDFLPELKGQVTLQRVRLFRDVKNTRMIELLATDAPRFEDVVEDARLAIVVADMWPAAEEQAPAFSATEELQLGKWEIHL